MRFRVFIIVLLVSITASANATVTKIGFRAYTTATPVTCSVFGMKSYLRDTDNVTFQVFTPDMGLSRSLSLGTRGYANYSTNLVSNMRAVKFTCVDTGTNNPASVKVFLNGVETWFLTLSEGSMGIAP